MRAMQRSAGLIELLAWYHEMGVGDAVAETQTPWLERGDRPPGETHKPPPTAQGALPAPPQPSPQQPSPQQNVEKRVQATPQRRDFPVAAPDAAVMAARELARQAAGLDELAAALAAFEGCGLKATATKLCFYRGPPRARLMLIGEAPGREEDLEGKPFVGRAGRLLDKMLAAIGLGQDVHITNIVYWRPPGNRTPTPQEAQVCRPFLERQIALVAPEFLVLLGGAAAKHILGVTDGIMRMRGKMSEIAVAGLSLRAMATLHPAYLLRTPAAKRLAWRDLLLLKTALETPTASAQ